MLGAWCLVGVGAWCLVVLVLGPWGVLGSRSPQKFEIGTEVASVDVLSVNRFEDLRVWQLARTLSDDIGALIQKPAVQKDFAISNQLNAAALSTLANIAEGFVRGGSKEFAQFVRVAAGSNAEARALLHAAFGRRYVDRAEYERLVEMTHSIGRMLRVLERRIREPRTKTS